MTAGDALLNLVGYDEARKKIVAAGWVWDERYGWHRPAPKPAKPFRLAWFAYEMGVCRYLFPWGYEYIPTCVPGICVADPLSGWWTCELLAPLGANFKYLSAGPVDLRLEECAGPETQCVNSATPEGETFIATRVVRDKIDAEITRCQRLIACVGPGEEFQETLYKARVRTLEVLKKDIGL